MCGDVLLYFGFLLETEQALVLFITTKYMMALHKRMKPTAINLSLPGNFRADVNLVCAVLCILVIQKNV